MTNEEFIKGNIDLVRRWSVVSMNEYKKEMKRMGDLGMYGEAERLRWMAEGMGLCIIKLGEQIGLDAKESLNLSK